MGTLRAMRLSTLLDRSALSLALAGGLALASLAVGPEASASELSTLTRQDYYGGAYYRTALEHPTIQKIKSDGKRLARVAKDLGWKPKQLKEAVEKYDAIEGDIEALATGAIKAALDKTGLKGRVLDVLINTSEPKHVVVYVRWRGNVSVDMVKEASTIAYEVSQATPFVSTLSLAAIHPKADAASKEPVWSGKIGFESMGRIQPKRIDDGSADRLYARLFEGVESKLF